MVECTPPTVLQHTILLAHDPFMIELYPMITHTPLVAGNFPIQTLVARQQPTSDVL